MKQILRCLTVAAVMYGSCFAFAEDAVTLRYKMAKDQQQVYRKVETMKQSQSVLNMKIETEINSTEIGTRTLQETDGEGNLRFQSENKSLKVKAKIGPLGEYSFDSKSSDNDKGSDLGAALTPVYERMTGSSMTITHSPRGVVNKVEGFEELLKDVLKDNPIGAQFAGGGSDKAARFGFSEFFPVFSEKPVAPGDRWETPYELELPKIGAVKGKRIYTYVGPDKVGNRKTAKVTISSELAIDLNLDVKGAKVSGKMSIDESKGTLQFDPELGQIVSLENHYTISGNLNVSANGMEIPVTTEQTQRVMLELLPKLPE